MLIEELLPNPQYRYGANDAEDEVGKITLAKQFYVQQIADDGAIAVLWIWKKLFD